MQDSKNVEPINFQNSPASDWKSEGSRMTVSRHQASQSFTAKKSLQYTDHQNARREEDLLAASLIPASPKRSAGVKKQKSARPVIFDNRLSVRVTSSLKRRIIKRSQTYGSSLSSCTSDLLLEALGLSTDEEAPARHQWIAKALAEQTMALNRVGNLLNHIREESLTASSPPFSQSQLNTMLRLFTEACEFHLRGGYCN